MCLLSFTLQFLLRQISNAGCSHVIIIELIEGEKTIRVPVKLLTGCPVALAACASAEPTSSMSSRCCGSSATASLRGSRKAAESKRATPSQNAAQRAYIVMADDVASGEYARSMSQRSAGTGLGRSAPAAAFAQKPLNPGTDEQQSTLRTFTHQDRVELLIAGCRVQSFILNVILFTDR